MPFCVPGPPPMLRALALSCLLGANPSLAAEEGRTSQKPEVAPYRVRGEATIQGNQPGPALAALRQGPAPTWIWGANLDRNYTLSKEFVGGSKSARVKASSDNKLTLFVNGRRVASG